MGARNAVFVLAAAAAAAGFGAQARVGAIPDAGMPAGYRPVLVSRDMSDPMAVKVQPSQWVTASGTWRPTDARAEGAVKTPGGAHGLHSEVVFQDGSFSFWTLDWVDCVIPGELKSISYWSRGVGPDACPSAGSEAWPGELHVFDTGTTNVNGKTVSLADAGHPGEGGKEYKISINAPTSGEWSFTSNAIPEKVLRELRMPVRIGSLATWRGGGGSRTNCWEVCDMRVTTDVGMIPEDERPWSLSITMPATANVFYHGRDAPRFVLAAGSWIGVEKTIRCKAHVEKFTRDGFGPRIPVAVPPMRVLDAASVSVELPAECREPGAYRLTVAASGMPEERTETMTFAVVREPPALTEAQKKASPYGVNVHGGTSVGYENFARIGMCWVRDYAFNFHWLKRAKGEGAYRGWPWYPKIVKAAGDAGLYTLPCLMGAMDEAGAAARAPDAEWRRQLAGVFASDTFKGQCCWELDNERDGRVDPESDEYGLWHKAFAETLHAVRPDAWAVEQGGASIHVAADRRHILSGAYRDIDVLNGHNYAGGRPPEIARGNFNANASKGEGVPMYLRDLWRNWRRVSGADGKERQLWVTEWGFDWLAGYVNTPWEQAAYMQREWILAMGAGIDKMFWYWYYDNAGDAAHAHAYYDGMGMFSSKRQPRPVTAAFCAMRAALPADMEYVGWASLSPNHMAHVLRLPDGSLTGLAFKIDPEGDDLAIEDPAAREVRDMFGATLKPGTRTLGIDPTWYIGLDPGCDWARQAPMDVLSDTFVRNVSGEPLRVELANPGGFDYDVSFLDGAGERGWSAERREWGFDVTGPAGVPRGEIAFLVRGRNGKAAKRVRVDVAVVPQAYAKSYAADFGGAFKVDVVNQSSTSRAFRVAARHPPGWAVEPAERTTRTLEPGGRETLEFNLADAAPAVPASGTAAAPSLEVRNSDGMLVDAAPVIPREWVMPRASADFAADGRLGEWTDECLMPPWMVGPRGDREASRLWAAWREDGLFLAVDVADSTRAPGDPDWFWRANDELEVMVGTGGPDFTPGRKWGDLDHQFIFMPFGRTGEAGREQVRPWAWRWSNCDSQPMLKYDEDGYPGASFGKTIVRTAPTADGYVMEVFIPKEYINGWNPKAGGLIGFSWQMAIGGARGRREAYWPAGKGDEAMKRPWLWGRVTLGGGDGG